MENRQTNRQHPVHICLILVLLFATGWFGGFLYQGGGRWLVDAFRLGYLTQFQIRAGITEGTRTYYVSTNNQEALLDVLNKEPGVSDVEQTFIDNLLIVDVSDETPQTFNSLRRSPFVNVITTIPLFCH